MSQSWALKKLSRQRDNVVSYLPCRDFHCGNSVISTGALTRCRVSVVAILKNFTYAQLTV